MNIHLARIRLYPIKSLDPIEVDAIEVLSTGALRHDRQFALIDQSGDLFTAKRSKKIQQLRTTYDLANRRIEVTADGQSHAYSLDHDAPAAESFFSEFLEIPLRLVENTTNGFPDDLGAPGPTVVSTATLETVAGWFGLEVEEVRRRFRANLEIGGVEPFWEDRLYGPDEARPKGATVQFTIGTVAFLGTNPCQRCPVPTRNSFTGEADRMFEKAFSSRREAELPPWSPRSRFNHFYRLATNTRPAEMNLPSHPRHIHVGDEVRVA